MENNQILKILCRIRRILMVLALVLAAAAGMVYFRLEKAVEMPGEPAETAAVESTWPAETVSPETESAETESAETTEATEQMTEATEPATEATEPTAEPEEEMNQQAAASENQPGQLPETQQEAQTTPADETVHCPGDGDDGKPDVSHEEAAP